MTTPDFLILPGNPGFHSFVSSGSTKQDAPRSRPAIVTTNQENDQYAAFD